VTLKKSQTVPPGLFSRRVLMNDYGLIVGFIKLFLLDQALKKPLKPEP
jgi:hypothetical protein